MRRDLLLLNEVKSEIERNSFNDNMNTGLEPIMSDKEGFLDYIRWVPTDDKEIIDGTDTLISKEHRPGRSPYL